MKTRTRKIFNKIYRLIAFLLIVSTSMLPQQGCEKLEYLIVNCSECYVDKPQWGELIPKVSLSTENPFVLITVYEGPFEDNKVFFVDTVKISNKKFWVQTKTHYTVRAEYKKDNRTYYVINGIYLKTRRDSETCDRPCYYVIGSNVDLRLKF